MIYSKNLFITILVRVILIMITSFVFIAIIPYLHKEYYFSLIGVGGIIIFQIYMLVNYLNKTNKTLVDFFSSIQLEEQNLVYPNENKSKIIDSFAYSLNELNHSISLMRRENVKQNLFLKNLIEHIGIGLLSYNHNGDIDIFNNAAKELIGLQELRNLNTLKIKLPEVYQGIISLTPDKQQLVKLVTNKSALYLSLKLSIIKSGKEIIKLISIQNIKTELEQKELDSWQKLIRVLTHEISNSVSPIASLANTTKKYFTKFNVNEQDNAFLQKAVHNLNTIENTGKGLIEFVGEYKSLTALPYPRFEKFPIKKLFKNLETLFSENTDSSEVQMFLNQNPDNLEITADFNLLEKVFINLIKNSCQALKKTTNPRIEINAFINTENHVVISVRDNGTGVSPEIIDDIFIPFYTTKDNGSGIGLSLSKQILRLHNASITVISVPNKETEFVIVF